MEQIERKTNKNEGITKTTFNSPIKNSHTYIVKFSNSNAHFILSVQGLTTSPFCIGNKIKYNCSVGSYMPLGNCYCHISYH